MSDKYDYACNKCNHKKTVDKVFYAQRKNQKLAIILQNPGPPSDKDAPLENYKLSLYKAPFRKSVYHRRNLKNWLLDNKNKNFFMRFFKMLADNNIIPSRRLLFMNDDDLREYVNTYLFNDFYITDMLKCRGNTMEFNQRHFDNCRDRFLSSELEELKELEAIFVFSTRSWNSFKSKYKITPVTAPSNIELSVTQAHGYLYKTLINNNEIHVIPSSHMSPVSRNNTLRNSYFDYLEQGIKDLSRKI